MRSRAELKLSARRALLGKYGKTILSLFLLYAVMLALAVGMEIIMVWGSIFLSGGPDDGQNITFTILAFGVMSALMMFLMFLFLGGFARLYLNICRDSEVHATDIFWCFKNCFGKFAGISILLTLLIELFMLPDVVLAAAAAITGQWTFAYSFLAVYNLALGILVLYAALTYGMFFMILADQPEKGILEALVESRELMKGNRRRYFVLCLSFLGWILLGYVTFGIGYLWIIPYIGCTCTFFYLDLKYPQPVACIISDTPAYFAEDSFGPLR